MAKTERRLTSLNHIKLALAALYKDIREGILSVDKGDAMRRVLNDLSTIYRWEEQFTFDKEKFEKDYELRRKEVNGHQEAIDSYVSLQKMIKKARQSKQEEEEKLRHEKKGEE
jgi:hypothetical protein